MRGMCWDITSWVFWFFNVNDYEHRCFRGYICSQSLKRAAEPNPLVLDGEELVAMGSVPGDGVRRVEHVHIFPFFCSFFFSTTSIKTLPKHRGSSSVYETQTLSK